MGRKKNKVNIKNKTTEDLKSTSLEKKEKPQENDLLGHGAITQATSDKLEDDVEVCHIQNSLEKLHFQPPAHLSPNIKKKGTRNCFYIQAYGQAKHLVNMTRIFARLPLQDSYTNSKKPLWTLIETPEELEEVFDSVQDLGPRFSSLARSGCALRQGVQTLYTTLPEQPGSVFMCGYGSGTKITKFFRLLCNLPNDELHPSRDVLQLKGEKLEELLNNAWILNVSLY